MLSLRRIKSLFLHGKPRPEANSARGLSCKNKAFYFPETQYGRRVSLSIFLVVIIPFNNSSQLRRDKPQVAQMQVVNACARANIRPLSFLLDEFALFWMSQCATCFPAWRILHRPECSYTYGTFIEMPALNLKIHIIYQ